MINGIKDGSSLRPIVTADMLSFRFIEQERRRIIDNSNNHYNLNNNYFDEFSDNNHNDHSNLEYPSSPSTKSSTNSSKVMPDNPEHLSESHSHVLNSDLPNFQKKEKDIIAGKKSLGKKNSITINKTITSAKPRLAVHSFLEKDTKKSPVLNSQKIERDLFSVKGKDQSDKINTDLLIGRRDRNTISLNQHQQQSYLSKNMDIETESIYRNILQRLKKREILKTQSEPSITINVGKITVRAVNDYNNISFSSLSSAVNNNNYSKESGQSKKLSLSDYLKKRVEKI